MKILDLDSNPFDDSESDNSTRSSRLMSIINWIYEHTLNYPLVEDTPSKIKTGRDSISIKIFSGYYNQHQLFK